MSQGHDPNCRDERGTSPLGAATRQGRCEVMRALLAAGTDPNGRDSAGRTPMSLVTRQGAWSDWYGKPERAVVADLLAAGADPEVGAGEGRTMQG